ncbi:MAG: M67 family metallopeptidase [Candidatus Binataceae bacterium]|jgi:adenylyltransferase/sulfurtransferase
MTPIRIRRENFAAIIAQAEREFPDECCGLVIGDGPAEQVRPIRNVQNQKHTADPVNYPRNARDAFTMDPKQVLAVLEESDRSGLPLKIVYHSHPDHDAYFSAVDRTRACSLDPAEPDFPDVAHLVLSVKAGDFVRAAAFIWDSIRKDFVETEFAPI